MKKHIITILRWIGVVLLPIPGAYLVSILSRFCWYMMGFENSFVAHVFESFGMGAAVPFVAYFIAPRKGAVAALVVSSLLIAFLVFCMGVWWYNITLPAFLYQCVVFAGIIVGVIMSFHIERDVANATEN